MAKSELLIPDDVRALYEELLAEGSRIVPRDDPFWDEPRVRCLLRTGLAGRVGLEPPMLVPTSPSAATAYISLLWRDAMNRRRTACDSTHAAAITFELRAARGAAALHGSAKRWAVISGQGHVAALHQAVTRGCERTLCEFSTGPYGAAKTLPTGEPHPVGSLYVPTAPGLIARGGEQRVVTDLDFVLRYPEYLASGHADGEEIRVSRERLPMKLTVADDDTVLVPLEPYGNPCLLIHDRQLVTLFAAFFELFWAHAEPWTPDDMPTTASEDLTRQRILDALASGQKDEAIARHLGISARTVRRHVAQIMRDLGATTRFAAGVAAVRQGVVPQQRRLTAATMPRPDSAGQRRAAAQKVIV